LVKGKGKGLPQQAWTGPRSSRLVKAPDFLDVRHHEGGRSSALRTGRLYPRINPWYSFLETESTPRHIVPSVATEKIPSDTTGNRSRDRPTSSSALTTTRCHLVHSVIKMNHRYKPHTQVKNDNYKLARTPKK